jgi:hypothetical protein
VIAGLPSRPARSSGCRRPPVGRRPWRHAHADAGTNPDRCRRRPSDAPPVPSGRSGCGLGDDARCRPARTGRRKESTGPAPAPETVRGPARGEPRHRAAPSRGAESSTGDAGVRGPQDRTGAVVTGGGCGAASGRAPAAPPPAPAAPRPRRPVVARPAGGAGLRTRLRGARSGVAPRGRGGAVGPRRLRRLVAARRAGRGAAAVRRAAAAVGRRSPRGRPGGHRRDPGAGAAGRDGHVRGRGGGPARAHRPARRRAAQLGRARRRRGARGHPGGRRGRRRHRHGRPRALRAGDVPALGGAGRHDLPGPGAAAPGRAGGAARGGAAGGARRGARGGVGRGAGHGVSRGRPP